MEISSRSWLYFWGKGQSYTKARLSYYLVSASLLASVFLGIEVREQVNLYIVSFTIGSPRYLPLVLFILFVYFFLRFNSEWRLLPKKQRKNKTVRLDFQLAHIFAFLTIELLVFYLYSSSGETGYLKGEVDPRVYFHLICGASVVISIKSYFYIRKTRKEYNEPIISDFYDSYIAPLIVFITLPLVFSMLHILSGETLFREYLPFFYLHWLVGASITYVIHMLYINIVGYFLKWYKASEAKNRIKN